MPHRKKSSKKQSPSRLTQQDLAQYCSGCVNGEDSFETVKEWVRNGKYTIKLFAKLLPNTAQDITQGRLLSEQVGYSLESTYVWLVHRDDTTRLRHLSCVLADVMLPRTASSLARAICSIQVGRFLCHPEVREGFSIGIQSSLAEIIQGVKSFYTSGSGIDRIAQTPELRGVILPDSPVFTLTDTDFVNAVISQAGNVNTEELGREREEARAIANAFLRITVSFHSTFFKCWECSQVFENTFHCGRCEAAVYCSRKCQAKAWKGGHKGKCDRLKQIHEVFLTGVEEYGKAHVTGFLDGFKLCPLYDHLVVNHCMEAMASEQKPGLLKHSMKHYYENLGRVIRGEWWVYDMSTEDNSSTGDETLDCEEFKILSFLTVDWFGCTRGVIGTSDRGKVLGLTDMFFRQVCGRPISAEMVLKLYAAADVEPCGRILFPLRSYRRLRELYNELD